MPRIIDDRNSLPERIKSEFEEDRMTEKRMSAEAEQIMKERFGKDAVLALATTEDGIPYVRYVDAFYENGSFYVVTYALSNKIRQIDKNPVVAISGEWFTGHGKGINSGFFGKAENRQIAEKLRDVFSEWIDNGHTDLSDENTIILRIELTDGILFSHGIRYEF